MNPVATNETITITPVDCWKCHGWYGLDETARLRFERDGGRWTCPYCEAGTGYKTTEVKRLQAELDRQRARADRESRQRVSAEHRLRATKGVVTKIKRRVAAGVCPQSET